MHKICPNTNMAAREIAREIIQQSIPPDRPSPFFLYFHSPSMSAGQRDALKITAPLEKGKQIICLEFVNKSVYEVRRSDWVGMLLAESERGIGVAGKVKQLLKVLLVE